MNQPKLAYITSERFIHDDLVRRSQQVVDEVKKLWETGEKIDAYAISWPNKTVRADNGAPVNRAVIMMLPTENDRKKALAALIERTQSYGLLVIEVKPKEIGALFETAHGSRQWTIPIERHGDRWALGDQRTKDDAECLGLLWSPKQGRA